MDQPDVSNLITVQQAIQIIDSAGAAARPARVEFPQCLGLFLCEDVLADRDAPAFDKSLMDGYAVQSADGERELQLVETIAAGEAASESLHSGQAMAIMTGAPVPAGADAVVPVELAEILPESNRVRILESTRPGRNIASRGCDARGGGVVLKKSGRIGPAQIAVAASIGAVNLPAFAPPSVAIVGTGDELVAPDKTPTGSQIRSCNNAMLLALLGKYPCRPIDLGLVWDEPGAIEEKIKLALSHDIVLITGGMSMGERDFVPGILRKLSGELKITKLRIKPGKPFVFAEMPGGKFAFGLPGNPVSAFICTLRLVSRLIMRIAGGSPEPRIAIASLAQPLDANGPREFYQPAIFDRKTLMPLRWVGSADVFTLARANAVMIRTENQPALSAGDAMEFMEI